jgi:hypothetical protein
MAGELRLAYKVPSSWNELVNQRGSVRIEKSRKKYVDCLTYEKYITHVLLNKYIYVHTHLYICRH